MRNKIIKLILLLAGCTTPAFAQMPFSSSGIVPVGTSSTATMFLSPNNGQTGSSASSVQPPVLAFGKQGTSTASMAVPISVNNCSTTNIPACTGSGNLTLGVTPFVISGANAADFTFSLGGCTTSLVIAIGGTCSGTITFTPTQVAGTNETATLTVNANAVNGNQTMSLTGTSATVTTIGACQALSSGVNYQLTGNVSAPSSCMTVGTTTGTDLNLNGFTITYCTTPSASHVGGVLMNGNFTTSLTVHNGTITEGGACTGLTPINGYGSGAVIAHDDGQTAASRGTTLFNLTITVAVDRAKVMTEQNAGNTTALSTTIHDIIYTDNDAYTCNAVGCRSKDQGYPIVIDQSANAGPTAVYNVTGTGSTQGGLVSTAANSHFYNNLISPGNVTNTNTNGFILQDWGPGTVIEKNLTTGSGTGGSCLSCRGIQVSSANNIAVTGATVQNNIIFTTNLNNNAEYGGCQIDGSYGIQLNTAGSGKDLSNNTFQNNTVIVTSNQCPGFGFSDSNSTVAAGPNKLNSNTFTCNFSIGHTSSGPCAGIRFDGNQYSPHPDNSVQGNNSIFIGDTSAIYIFNDGSPAWTCNQCTFGKGANPSGSYVMFDNFGGAGISGSTAASSGLFSLVDPTFSGTTKSSNNLNTWATNNPTFSSSYIIQWTYTVTVQRSSNSTPISGATVTMTDTGSTVECNGTTNVSGVFSCVVNDTKYQAVSGVFSTPSFNPFALQITAAGCTTLNQSGKTITATTSETKQLAGC